MKLGVPRLRGRSTVLLLPLVWLAVVVVVAGLTWQVIDSAGRDVLTSGGPPLSAAGSTPDAGGAPSGTPGEGGSDRPSKEPRPSKSASPTEPPAPSAAPASRQPDVSPSQASSAPPAPSPGQQTSPPPSAPSSSPAQQTQVRSWQGTAGSVTAACTGASISLRSATPYDGWSVEVDDRGPDRVRVEFTSGGEDERETEVEAVCSGGAPHFAVETKD